MLFVEEFIRMVFWFKGFGMMVELVWKVNVGNYWIDWCLFCLGVVLFYNFGFDFFILKDVNFL